MLSRLRLLLACLLMLALPLQGMAAASMLFCGMGHEAAAQEDAVPAHPHADAHADMHAQAGAHDHAAMLSHSHDGAQADAGDTHMASAAAKAGNKAGNDTAHKCNVCATCCQAAAIAGFTAPVQLQPLPQADLAEPFVLIHARASAVPDKPPRLARI